MNTKDVQAVAFDVNETLFSLAPLGGAFEAVGLDPAAVPRWFAQLLRDGFALTAMGQYRTFGELAAETLRAQDPGRVDDAAVETVLGAFRQLDPHPDVEPAFRTLRNAGVPAVTLTNGSAELVGALLARAGLTSYVQRSFTVDDVQRWKPAPEPYHWMVEQLGLAPRQVALVASHPWDCAGARAAGLVAGWIDRGTRWPSVFAPPDETARDLPVLITALLGRDPAG
jgi:2-haloacid dehalogenase